VRAIFADHGIELPEYPHVSAENTPVVAAEFADAIGGGNWESVGDPAPLDVVALRAGHGDLVTHCGVCLGGGRFIHTTERTGATVSRFSHPFWGQQIAGYYRWRPANNPDTAHGTPDGNGRRRGKKRRRRR
jgi:cell wall-associated NlpC family hydrolase